MTGYTNTDGVHILDAALELIAAGEPVQMRVSAEGHDHFAVGYIESAWTTGARDIPTVFHVNIGGRTLDIREGQPWEVVAAERVQSTLIVEPERPLTEDEWRQTPEYIGAGDWGGPADEARPVIVMWHDPTETPSEAVARLNAEAIEYAKRAEPPFRASTATELRVHAVRWENGDPIGWREAVVVRRYGVDAYIVRFESDGVERGALVSEIRTTANERTRLIQLQATDITIR
jgi:hypothetical protein